MPTYGGFKYVQIIQTEFHYEINHAFPMGVSHGYPHFGRRFRGDQRTLHWIMPVATDDGYGYCLVVNGCHFFFIFPLILGIIIIPTDEVIFFRGVGIQPPTRLCHLVSLCECVSIYIYMCFCFAIGDIFSSTYRTRIDDHTVTQFR